MRRSGLRRNATALSAGLLLAALSLAAPAEAGTATTQLSVGITILSRCEATTARVAAGEPVSSGAVEVTCYQDPEGTSASGSEPTFSVETAPARSAQPAPVQAEATGSAEVKVITVTY